MNIADEQRWEALGIKIVREKMTVAYEQTLQLADRAKIQDALSYLQIRLAREGMTGQITSEMQGGGCRAVIVRHVGNIPIGSVLQREIDALFDKKDV